MMGEGFVVMQSTDVKVHFYMDQPGNLRQINAVLMTILD